MSYLRSNAVLHNIIIFLAVSITIYMFYTVLFKRGMIERFDKLFNDDQEDTGSKRITRDYSHDPAEVTPVRKVEIGIIVVLEGNTNADNYKRPLDTLRCYARIQEYPLIITNDKNFTKLCPHTDKFFRRHCVAAQYLIHYDYLLFLDADMGVVNPKKRVEDYIDDRFDITFYDRFFNQEIAAGAYLAKNSEYSIRFLNEFSDYNYKLPNSFHGTDNGALQMYVLRKLFPDKEDEYKICEKLWNISKSYPDLFIYESCTRKMLGIGGEFPHIRILKKGTGWARDHWLTNSLWNPERDFITHGWRNHYLKQYSKRDLPIKISDVPKNVADWYYPFVGDFRLDLCKPGNTSWNIDPNLIAPVETINKHLNEYKRKVQMDGFRLLAKIPELLKF